MLNHIIIMGRVCNQIELRMTAGGTPVTTFTVAVDRDYTPKGEGKQTDFIEVVAWRNTAEFVSKYFGRGRMVVVDGKLQSRQWTDKNNNKRTEWEIQAENVYFADSKQSNGGSQSNGVEPQKTANNEFAEIEDDGELPF